MNLTQTRGGWRFAKRSLWRDGWAALLIAGLGNAAWGQEGPAPIVWQGTEQVVLEQLEESPAAAVEAWAPWAQEHDYRMELSTDARVLFLYQAKRRPKRDWKAIDATLELFDEWLPSQREEVVVRPASAPVEPARLRTRAKTGPPETVLDFETCVLIQARDAATYQTAVEHVAKLDPYLANWVPRGRAMNGFVLERPLAAAWSLDGRGNEEWDPENELVHRLTRLLCARRFGTQPYWVKLGLAWQVENTVCGDIYCMPYRDSFVSVSEHSSWVTRLKRLAKKRKAPYSLKDVSGLERGRFDDQPALLAFGAIGFLARHRPEGLGAALRGMHAAHEEKSVIRHADGSWEKIGGFELSREDQAQLFEECFEKGMWEELTRALSKGKSYRPRRR